MGYAFKKLFKLIFKWVDIKKALFLLFCSGKIANIFSKEYKYSLFFLNLLLNLRMVIKKNLIDIFSKNKHYLS